MSLPFLCLTTNQPTPFPSRRCTAAKIAAERRFASLRLKKEQELRCNLALARPINQSPLAQPTTICYNLKAVPATSSPTSTGKLGGRRRRMSESNPYTKLANQISECRLRNYHPATQASDRNYPTATRASDRNYTTTQTSDASAELTTFKRTHQGSPDGIQSPLSLVSSASSHDGWSSSSESRYGAS